MASRVPPSSINGPRKHHAERKGREQSTDCVAMFMKDVQGRPVPSGQQVATRVWEGWLSGGRAAPRALEMFWNQVGEGLCTL